MSLGQVDKDISQTAPNKDLDAVWWFAVRELAEVLRKLRTKWNAFANDIDTNGILTMGSVSVTSGTGLPVTAPAATRALYIRIDGGVGSTAYVWEGAAWRAL
jgi:hypothetical protein